MADEVAEVARRIVVTVTAEIFPAHLAMVKGKEDGLHHVEHIDKGEGLWLIAYKL